MATALKKPKTEVKVSRIFDAPRALAWKAWTDSEDVKKWWGPKRFIAPHISIDLRVGGKFLFCMRGAGPDGAVKDYWNTGEHRKIAPREKIVMAMGFADEQGHPVPASHYGMPGKWPPETLVSAVFADVKGGKTKVTVTEKGIPKGVIKLARMGWEEQFDKFADVLALAQDKTRIIAEPGTQDMVVMRSFDAPRTFVFKAYTDPALIPQWWGPRRYSTIVDRLDARPGGLWRFINRDAAGKEYAFHGVFHEIAAPHRLISTFEFEDREGHVQLETTIFEESRGRTTVTSRSVYQTAEDRDGALRAGMVEGLIETMDRLAKLLVKLGSVEQKAA